VTTRREFLHAASAAALAASIGFTLPIPAIAAMPKLQSLADFWLRDRRLWVRRRVPGHPNRWDEFDVIYWSNGQLDQKSYVKLCYLMRDVEARQATVEIHPDLFSVLYGVQEWTRLLGHRDPVIWLHSGVRIPPHNASVEGAAIDSWHIYGAASDISIDGVPNAVLSRQARFFGMGGVGLYPSHVHVDVGPVRDWHGGANRPA
jgi:uncharacterized protein YcbK (DUF882 family)